MPWTSCRSRWCSWWNSAWPSLGSSFPPVHALPCPNFWVCGPSLVDTHGRLLFYALLRCLVPVLGGISYVDFRAFGKGEVRRISLPRTPVHDILFALLLHNRYYWQLGDG